MSKWLNSHNFELLQFQKVISAQSTVSPMVGRLAHSFKRHTETNYDGHHVEESHRAIYCGVINRTGTGELPDALGRKRS
jgi:hypothetical protein